MAQGARSSSRSLSTQITWLSAAFAVVVLVSIAVFGWWAVTRIDERGLAREIRFAQIGLEEFANSIPKDQDSSAIWDEAVVAVRADDGRWMEENLVEWMSEYYGHDAVFVLNPRDEPIRAAIDGRTAQAFDYESRRPFVEPIVEKLRATMAEAAAGKVDSTEAIAGLGALDVVAVDDAVAAIVSVRPIIPGSTLLAQAPGTEFLHVSVKLIDAPMTAGIGNKFSLEGLTFSRQPGGVPGQASSPVLSASGRIVGFFNWMPDRPASELVVDTAPAASIIFVIALIGLVLLLRRLKRTSSRLEVSEAHAQYLAFHDPLTGVPNRALFEDRLERALASMRRTKSVVALHYLDLDRFKHVNDTLGHPAGDELIRQAARRISDTIREVDTLARLGGDEFAIIQLDADQIGSERLCERIIAEIDKPYNLSGDEARVGVSIGVVLSNDPESTPKDMMRKADIALYEAKANGRGRFQIFAGGLDDNVRERRSIERDLRTALYEDSGLKLHYQPIFCAATGAMLGAEALVRWEHPVRGTISPAEFIGIAEERGLIDQLGYWVLRTACGFAARSDVPWVAVNVSPMQFRDEHFAQRVLAILAECNLPARRLEIEITEGLLLQNSPLVQSTLMHLRAAGVRVALDDFGTGYSSISYLRTYGVDKLKIDRSFVDQLGQGRDIDSIVKSIIDLARAMHMKVTAEGVETILQRDVLIGMGCDQLQGFLLSRPLPDDQVDDMLLGAPQPRRIASA